MLKIGKKLSSGQPDSIIDRWETNFADSMPSNEVGRTRHRLTPCHHLRTPE
jgi:hypothetical protein